MPATVTLDVPGYVDTRYKCRGCPGVGGFSQEADEIRHEFSGGVGVEHFGRSVDEDNTVEKGLHQSSCLSIWQRDNGHVAGGGINNAEGLGFARQG